MKVLAERRGWIAVDKPAGVVVVPARNEDVEACMKRIVERERGEALWVVHREGKPIATDRLLLGWRAPGQGDPDWAVLDLIATLLAGSPSTRLYRRLVVERELASTVDTQLTPFRDPSLLRVAVTLARGHRADEALAEIDDVVRGLIERPVAAEELAKAKNLVETDFWAGLTDPDGKAEALGHHETALGDFRSLTTLAERLAAVTAQDVQRVAREYLRKDRRSIVIAEPDGDEGEDGDEEGDGGGHGHGDGHGHGHGHGHDGMGIP